MTNTLEVNLKESELTPVIKTVLFTLESLPMADRLNVAVSQSLDDNEPDYIIIWTKEAVA